MSNQEDTSSSEPVKHEPAKRAPKTPESKPARRRGGFFRSLISHLMVATIAVIGVGAYLHWSDVLKYTGSKVCAYDMLGQYASQPAKVPPIDLKTAPTKKEPAKEPDQSAGKAVDKAVDQKLSADWDAARKLFWNKENTAALAAYQELVKQHPDNAKLRVELGNVLYKNGKVEEAANEYFSAGEKFDQQNNTAQVVEIKKILEKIAPIKAKELSDVLK